ncbi:hypothetical protein [Sphingobium xenophagum]|nr:hypothetical protein [Sphingobium xenophagum]
MRRSIFAGGSGSEHVHGLVTAGRGVIVALAMMRHDRLHLPG